MFYKENESTSVDVEMNQGTNKQVELKVRASETVEEIVSIVPFKKVVHDIIDKKKHLKNNLTVLLHKDK